MNKMFSKILTLVLVVCLAIGALSGISVAATGANKNSVGVARALSDEGIVLMKNENNALPLKQGANIAIFGEGQHLRLYTAEDFNHDNSMGIETLQKQHGYIPWGAGSSRALGVGGKDAAVDPLDALKMAEELGRINIYDAISQGYINALETSNSDETFVEYIPTEADYQGAVAAGVDTAIVVISRFDGECVDLPKAEWDLFESEKSVLQNATRHFKKVIVVLNTPTPINTNWAVANDMGIDVDSILFAGYGGMQGGYAIADVILGDVNPSGKLVTTYAKDLYDYPTTETFINDSSTQKYTEDIFLGYRYFETFDPEYTKVNFEFGFGLSYTTFNISTSDFKVEDGVVTVKATVTNTGNVAGKEVVQMYLSAPQGELGKAAKVLCGFDKTQLLQPGESETLTLTCKLNDLASFDDLGKTGNKSAYVLEAGDYKFYVGNSVKEAGSRLAGTHNVSELILVEQLTQQAKTNLDKRLLADGTFENLQVIEEEEVENALTTDTSVKVEAEDYYKKANGHTTEKFNGFIYEDGQWNTYTGTCLGATYSGSAIYKVLVGETGYYKLSFRMAKHTSYDSYSISVATSNTDSNFVTVADTGAQTLTKSGYHSYIDAPCATWVKLNEGDNYVKLAFTGSPNVDFFTVTGINYVPEGAIKIEGESFDKALSANGLSFENSKASCTLYNDADGLWYTYSATLMNNTYKGRAVYVVDVEKGGTYSVGMRAARHADTRYPTYQVTVKASATTTFADGITSPVIDKTNSAHPSSYHSFSDFKFDGTIELKKGVNYIQLTNTGYPNIDFFTLTLKEEKTENYVPEEKDEYYQLKDVVSGTVTMDDFVNQMTNEELATFYVSYKSYNFGGSDEVNSKYGFLRVSVSDGPSGIGSKGSSFPCETIIACTWNTDLVEAFGRVMGAELYDNNVEVWLAPGVNLHRNPLSGRNSEYYSEDPFISGIMAVTTIKAVQRYGVSVCIKHFVCNEKEGNKLAQDVRVSERALREIYLKPFEMAVKDAKAQGIMSSYNLVNGVAMNENKDILTNILRREWGHQYYISGDWNNNKDMIKEINAGHGVREPYNYCDIDAVIEAIHEGKIERETLLTGAKYELNTLMRGKRNYTTWTDEVCNGKHNYVNDVCSVCHAPDPMVFTNLEATLNSLVDNMTQTVGYKLKVTESTFEATSKTIIQGTFDSNINTLNSDKTRAELTLYNSMESKSILKVKMGIYVVDSNEWPRVSGDSSFSYIGDSGVYFDGNWLYIPYGATATVYCDLSNSKYDNFVHKKSDGTEKTYARSKYLSLVYLGAPDAKAGDSIYMKGENLSFKKNSILGTTLEAVNTDVAFIGTYNVESVLTGDYGKVLNSKLLTDAGLMATNGKFFDGNVGAYYVLKATDNADYIFKGWYDENDNLISDEELVRYNTLSVPAGENNIYAKYVTKNAKAFTNKIQGADLDIGSTLTVNYYADLDEAHKNAVLSVTRNGNITKIAGEKDLTTGMYVFSYEGINPQCMADNLKAELIFEGDVINRIDEYSVKKYAQNQLSKTAKEIGISQAKYDALKTLLSDMLFYGDASQDYKEYKQDNYATKDVVGLTPSNFTVPVDGVRVVSGNTDSNNQISSCGLNMSNVNRIYFNVKVTDATVYVDGKEVEPDANGKVYTDAIKATGFSTKHTAEIKKGDNVLAKVEYNVNAYIASKHNSPNVGNIVQALNNYGVAAKTYALTK